MITATRSTTSTTENDCQAVVSLPPAEYQGRNMTMSRPRPETAPTSSSSFNSASVSVGPDVFLHRQVAPHRDPAAGDQAEEEANLPIQIAGGVEHLVEDQQRPDSAQKRDGDGRQREGIVATVHQGQDRRNQRHEDDDQQVDVERVLRLPEAEVLRAADGSDPLDDHPTRDPEPRQEADDEQGHRGHRGY